MYQKLREKNTKMKFRAFIKRSITEPELLNLTRTVLKNKSNLLFQEHNSKWEVWNSSGLLNTIDIVDANHWVLDPFPLVFCVGADVQTWCLIGEQQPKLPWRGVWCEKQLPEPGWRCRKRELHLWGDIGWLHLRPCLLFFSFQGCAR